MARDLSAICVAAGDTYRHPAAHHIFVTATFCLGRRTVKVEDYYRQLMRAAQRHFISREMQARKRRPREQRRQNLRREENTAPMSRPRPRGPRVVRRQFAGRPRPSPPRRQTPSPRTAEDIRGVREKAGGGGRGRQAGMSSPRPRSRVRGVCRRQGALLTGALPPSAWRTRVSSTAKMPPSSGTGLQSRPEAIVPRARPVCILVGGGTPRRRSPLDGSTNAAKRVDEVR